MGAAVELLHKVLSYLSIRDAARTSVLSKEWNYAWETLPYLNFNHEMFTCANTSSYMMATEKNRDSLQVIKRMLRNRQHIEKFSLCFCPCTEEHRYRYGYRYRYRYPYRSEDHEIERIDDVCEIESLSFEVIKSLGMPSLKELEFSSLIACEYRYRHFLLPSTLLSAKHLTCLVLNGFNLCSSWSSSSLDINFPSLKKLHLTSAMIDDNVWKKLIGGSVSSLETLKLMRVIRNVGLNPITLDGEFVKLKQLRLEMIYKIEFGEMYDAPQLEELYVIGVLEISNFHKFNLKNCPLLNKIVLRGNFITENNFYLLLNSCMHLKLLDIRTQPNSDWENITISSDLLDQPNFKFHYYIESTGYLKLVWRSNEDS